MKLIDIHQNPVKAGIVERVKDYEYSSWSEFDGDLIVEPGSYPVEGKDGFQYADNKFVITLPVEMTL